MATQIRSFIGSSFNLILRRARLAIRTRCLFWGNRFSLDVGRAHYTVTSKFPTRGVPEGSGSTSCFISYSSKDQEFAERLHADLQNRGVRFWCDRHDMQGGRKIHEQIGEAIRLYDRLLLILSEDSIKSNWVKREIRKAQARAEQEKRRVLFPVRLVDIETLHNWEFLDPSTGKDFALEIQGSSSPISASERRTSTLIKAFERLLKDLKAENATAAPAARTEGQG